MNTNRASARTLYKSIFFTCNPRQCCHFAREPTKCSWFPVIFTIVDVYPDRFSDHFALAKSFRISYGYFLFILSHALPPHSLSFSVLLFDCAQHFIDKIFPNSLWPKFRLFHTINLKGKWLRSVSALYHRTMTESEVKLYFLFLNTRTTQSFSHSWFGFFFSRILHLYCVQIEFVETIYGLFDFHNAKLIRIAFNKSHISSSLFHK